MEPIFLPDVECTSKAGPARERLEAMEEQGVPVPQILHLFAFKPQMTDHLAHFTQDLMRGPSPLSAGQRELIAAFTSSRTSVSVLNRLPRRGRGGTARGCREGGGGSEGLSNRTDLRTGKGALQIRRGRESPVQSDSSTASGRSSPGRMVRRSDLRRHHGLRFVQLLQPLVRCLRRTGYAAARLPGVGPSAGHRGLGPVALDNSDAKPSLAE